MTDQLDHIYQWARWHQYDLYSTGSTVLMSTLNVLRSTLHNGSTEFRLRSTQAAYLVLIALHLCVLWLLLHRPALHARFRSLLTSARWLAVSALILASTGLPVFQEGAASPTSSWWIQRFVGMSFRSGLMFCFIGFLFYRMPWQHMAIVAFTYAACSSLTAPAYCASVVAGHGSGFHADLSILQETAAVLDMLVGQGQQQEGLAVNPSAPHASTGTGAAAAAAAAADAADGRWETTASLLAAACSGDRSQGSSAEWQKACSDAFLGQCQATLVTLKFGLSYVMLLLTVSLERYNKWQHLQQSRRRPRDLHHNAAQGGSSSTAATTRSGSAGPGAFATTGSSSSTGPSSDGSSRRGLLADPFQAPTAWAFLRLELLKLVVLADIPVLLLWHLLSSMLRPELTALQAAQ